MTKSDGVPGSAVQSEEAALCAELAAFCKSNSLPLQSADELAASGLVTEDQQEWLRGYCERWESWEAREVQSKHADESAHGTRRLDRMHPSLQIAMREWIIERLPRTGAALEARIQMPGGNWMITEEVANHMATAAMAVLEQACSCAGLDGS